MVVCSEPLPSQHFRAASMDSNSGYSSFDELTPTHILSIAIRKRRQLHDQRESDLLREILNKKLIHQLCKQLGQKRSRRHSRRRGGSRSRSASKRRMSMGDEDVMESKRRCPYDNGKGDEENNSNEFEMMNEAPSMVHMNGEASGLDYSQMERMLDEREAETIQFNGYVGHWSASESVEPSTSISVIEYCGVESAIESVDSESSMSQMSVDTNSSTFILSSTTQDNDPAKAKSSNSQTLVVQSSSSDIVDTAPTLQNLDLDDPLEMKKLFAELYSSSYSIIEPTKDFGSPTHMLVVSFVF